MARYIDADALINDIKRIYCTDCNNYNNIRCRSCEWDDALRMLEDAPTEDVAPRGEIERLAAEIEELTIGTRTGAKTKTIKKFVARDGTPINYR